ncbi:MAG: winged helix-turn-helix transcriptional regulator [Clostridium sp.]
MVILLISIIYVIVEKGKSLLPILDSMCEWGGNNMPKSDNGKV